MQLQKGEGLGVLKQATAQNLMPKSRLDLGWVIARSLKTWPHSKTGSLFCCSIPVNSDSVLTITYAPLDWWGWCNYGRGPGSEREPGGGSPPGPAVLASNLHQTIAVPEAHISVNICEIISVDPFSTLPCLRSGPDRKGGECHNTQPTSLHEWMNEWTLASHAYYSLMNTLLGTFDVDSATCN